MHENRHSETIIVIIQSLHAFSSSSQNIAPHIYSQPSFSAKGLNHAFT